MYKTEDSMGVGVSTKKKRKVAASPGVDSDSPWDSEDSDYGGDDDHQVIPTKTATDIRNLLSNHHPCFDLTGKSVCVHNQ